MKIELWNKEETQIYEGNILKKFPLNENKSDKITSI